MSRTRALFLTIFFALAASLLTVRPAAAQYGALNLQDGDIVTVTGAGTASSRPGGTNAISSYDAGDNFYGVDAEAGSRFTLDGGSLSGEAGDSALYANSAVIQIKSGSVSVSGSGTDGIDAVNGSSVSISGGRFAASGGGASLLPPVADYSFSLTPLFGGPPLSAVDLYADSGSTITVTGGQFTATGTGTVGLFAINRGIITLYGSGFTVNGSPVIGPLTTGSGTLSGTLLDGSALFALPYTVLGGTIQFAAAAVPEASSWISLGVLLSLGAAGFCLRRQRSSLKDALLLKMPVSRAALDLW